MKKGCVKMKIEFGMFKRVFTEEVLEIVRQELIEMFEYETIDYLTEEEKDGCYLEVEEMSLERAIARVMTKSGEYICCDNTQVYYKRQIGEKLLDW